MPSRYSSDHSISDAVALAENLGVEYRTIAIEPGHSALMEMLSSSYDGQSIGLAEENLQSRLRAVTLMGFQMLRGTQNHVPTFTTILSAGGAVFVSNIFTNLDTRLCVCSAMRGDTESAIQ